MVPVKSATFLTPLSGFGIAAASLPNGLWDGVHWRTLTVLKVLVEYANGHKQVFTVPRFFITDGKSVPFWYRWRFRQWGRGSRAAAVHDYLWRCGFSWREADVVFRLLLREDTVGVWSSFVMKWTVDIAHVVTYRPTYNWQVCRPWEKWVSKQGCTPEEARAAWVTTEVVA